MKSLFRTRRNHQTTSAFSSTTAPKAEASKKEEAKTDTDTSSSALADFFIKPIRSGNFVTTALYDEFKELAAKKDLMGQLIISGLIISNRAAQPGDTIGVFTWVEGSKYVLMAVSKWAFDKALAGEISLEQLMELVKTEVIDRDVVMGNN